MGYLTPNSIPENTIEFCLKIPNEFYWVSAVLGALSSLGLEYNWEEYGELTIEEVTTFWNNYLSEEFIFSQGKCGLEIGMIIAYVGETIPENYLLCDATLYAKEDYPELWALMPPTQQFPNNFRVPDLNDHFVKGTTSTAQRGVNGGSNSFTLTTANLPAHAHSVSSTSLTAINQGEIPSFITQAAGATLTGVVGEDEPVVHVPKHERWYYIIRAK